MIASNQKYLLAMQEFCFDFIQKTLEQISLSYSLTKIANLNNYSFFDILWSYDIMIAEHNLEHNFTYCSLILMLQKEIYAVSFGIRETQSVYNLVEPGGLPVGIS